MIARTLLCVVCQQLTYEGPTHASAVSSTQVCAATLVWGIICHLVLRSEHLCVEGVQRELLVAVGQELPDRRERRRPLEGRLGLGQRVAVGDGGEVVRVLPDLRLEGLPAR